MSAPATRLRRAEAIRRRFSNDTVILAPSLRFGGAKNPDFGRTLSDPGIHGLFTKKLVTTQVKETTHG